MYTACFFLHSEVLTQMKKMTEKKFLFCRPRDSNHLIRVQASQSTELPPQLSWVRGFIHHNRSLHNSFLPLVTFLTASILHKFPTFSFLCSNNRVSSCMGKWLISEQKYLVLFSPTDLNYRINTACFFYTERHQCSWGKREKLFSFCCLQDSNNCPHDQITGIPINSLCSAKSRVITYVYISIIQTEL